MTMITFQERFHLHYFLKKKKIQLKCKIKPKANVSNTPWFSVVGCLQAQFKVIRTVDSIYILLFPFKKLGFCLCWDQPLQSAYLIKFIIYNSRDKEIATWHRALLHDGPPDSHNICEAVLSGKVVAL